MGSKEWIRAASRMPDEGVEVIVATTEGTVMSGYHIDEVWYDVSGGMDGTCDRISVSHWMPMPKHPEEGS